MAQTPTFAAAATSAFVSPLIPQESAKHPETLHPADEVNKQKAEKLSVLFGAKSLPWKARLSGCVLHASPIIYLGQGICLEVKNIEQGV